MINITEEIYIKADINKIWAYLTDFSLSLNFNRFHTNLEIPTNYSLGKMNTFKINHNFGFRNYNMVAKIKNCVPPHRLTIAEYCPDDPQKGFPHTMEFQIISYLRKSKIIYTVSGTYGGRVQNMSFKPILKGVMKEELLKIKNAIESSESASQTIISETINPV